ncbi:methyl-accepting chemotaxis protein [Comamonas sp. UBA7528]|uniref:methyl-accepting chemotaxis protein n=1 Tax=Comamonas sp. UBA7528 TaxID=1946391 RepID=UPI0025C092B4|nr:methyl-accepting chemotaxis protein [Comamonas sp. UBA7528]
MFQHLSLRSRLAAAMGFLALLLAVLGALGLYSLRDSNLALQSLVEQQLQPMQQLAQVTKSLDMGKFGVVSAIADPIQIDSDMDALEAQLKDSASTWEAFASALRDGQEQELAQQFAAAQQDFLQQGVRPAVAALRSMNLPGATELYTQSLAPRYPPARTALDALMALQRQRGEALYRATQQRYQQVFWLSVAAMCLGLLVAGVAGVTLVRAIARPLAQAVQAAQHVAAGDLSQDIPSSPARHETGQLLQALQQMNLRLRHIVGEVRQGTDAMALASQEISSGNRDLSQRTECQAAALQQTTASMHDLNEAVQRNAEHAQQASALAASATQIAQQGRSEVDAVAQAMGHIQGASQRIVDITAVIDGIAFQTNLLALNAAVEAARAGAQGRGFAVVAAEVRELAQRSAVAAKEIKGLIQHSVDEVEQGRARVAQAGGTMATVEGRVQHMAALVQDIAQSSQAQSAGLGQLHQAIAQMDDTTQKNAALVEQASAAALALQQQASALVDTVRIFRLDGVAAPVNRALPAAERTLLLA